MEPTAGAPAQDAPLTIKICGITRLEDGLCALRAGADWLGLIRWPRSPRFQPREACRELTRQLRETAERPFELVGVYVNAERATLDEEVAALGLDRVQLHGEETAEFARSLPWPTIKALRVRDPESLLAEAEAFEGLDLLTDAYNPTMPGGTGEAYDYSMLRALTARRRVLVAGGLDANNVGEMIRELRPWGVDISSRVEISPGVKDPAKITAFISAARSALRRENA